MKIIGAVIIDSGVFKDSGVPIRLIAPKHFSCDSITLSLCSENTVYKLLSLNGHQDPRLMVVACLNLFSTRAHAFSVNIKHSLKTIEIFQVIWHSLLWFLHIDSVSIISKKNYSLECVSLCFIILRNDITQPHLLATEPSEHANALMRGMTQDFTVKDLIYLVAKVDRFWEAIVSEAGGGINLTRKVIQGTNGAGHVSTLSVSKATLAEKIW